MSVEDNPGVPLERLSGVEAIEEARERGPFAVSPLTRVRFSDGSTVGVGFERTSEEAAAHTNLAAGPGDPFAYKSVGNAVLASRGPADDPHLEAVEGCLR